LVQGRAAAPNPFGKPLTTTIKIPGVSFLGQSAGAMNNSSRPGITISWVLMLACAVPMKSSFRIGWFPCPWLATGAQRWVPGPNQKPVSSHAFGVAAELTVSSLTWL
jgi:hypothetical protein